MITRLQKYCFILTMTSLSACQSAGPAGEIELNINKQPHELMGSIASNIQKCWLKRGDPNFRKLRMANELNSYAGRPRLLLVPKNNPTGLPSLVVQAQKLKGSTRLHAFGPLLATRAGKIISTDLKNWTSGKAACLT